MRERERELERHKERGSEKLGNNFQFWEENHFSPLIEMTEFC